MRKSLMLTALFAAMLVSGAVYANPAQPAEGIQGPRDIGVEKVFFMHGSNGFYELIDHNPTRYSKKQMGNAVVESWIEDGTAYTSVNGGIKKSYKVDAHVKLQMAPNGEMYERVGIPYYPKPLKPSAS